jgi:ABC-type antimicrobial peptide transport system permease subunit
MKHLISLSMKYIRRQKLRTILTFMCITLSAFILATVCTYGSSLFSTLINYTKDEDGAYEAELSSWIDHADDPQKARETIKGHPVVEDYYCYDMEFLFQEKEKMISFFEVSDGKTSYRIRNAALTTSEGNIELKSKYDDRSAAQYANNKGVYVSDIFKDMGYKEGDTVTLTIRPALGRYDENAKIIKDIRAELKEKYGTEYTVADAEYEELSEELKSKASKASIYSILLNQKNIGTNDAPVTDITYGEPVELTFKITGFLTSANRSKEKYLDILNTGDDKLSLSEVYEKNPDIRYEDEHEIKIRTIDSMDYDDALKKLFGDLGFNVGKDYYDNDEYPHRPNTLLLALEWKSSDAVGKVIPMAVVPALILLLIAWFIARFVIDNAFEMAAQERSTHFAALRVMGASKLQVATVVLAEAVFYIFTAIPLGIISAILICRSSMNSFKRLGFPMFEFSAKPLFIGLAIFLSVIAVLISAYTSAMWAARKLSPAEALNFGKPRSKKKKLKKSKSRLDLSSKKFLRRYTRKNIGAAKSRFIVATITMGLGVLMFTFSSLMALSTYKELKKDMGSDSNQDFWILGYYSSDQKNALNELNKVFGDKEIFNDVHMEAYYQLTFNCPESTDPLLRSGTAVQGDKETRSAFVHTIDRKDYEKAGLEKLIGMSYDEFASSDCFFKNIYDQAKIGDSFTAPEKETYIEFYSTDTKKRFIGAVRSQFSAGGFIIPLESAAEFDLPIDITLTTNREHYEEAEKIFNDFTANNTVSYFQNAYMVGTGLMSFLKAIAKVLLTFLVSIWLVGILSMINSVNTSVLNRSRELMMLRSVGMTRKQLRKSVLMETMMFSATAAIIGTILGVLVFIPVWDEPVEKCIGNIITIVIISLIVNTVIAILSAIPATRTLEKVDSIAQAVNR